MFFPPSYCLSVVIASGHGYVLLLFSCDGNMLSDNAIYRVIDAELAIVVCLQKPTEPS